MRYPALEKLEIIRLVERSQRPVKWTLDKLGLPRRTFYRWHSLNRAAKASLRPPEHCRPFGNDDLEWGTCKKKSAKTSASHHTSS